MLYFFRWYQPDWIKKFVFEKKVVSKKDSNTSANKILMPSDPVTQEDQSSMGRTTVCLIELESIADCTFFQTLWMHLKMY